MCGVACGVATAVLGTALLLTSTIVGYGLMGGILENVISNEVVLYDDTLQMERFEEVPFPLNFTIRIFNITNPEAVLAGAIPVVNEVGPYIYKNDDWDIHPKVYTSLSAAAAAIMAHLHHQSCQTSSDLWYRIRLYVERVITNSDELTLDYHRSEHFEFDAAASYPNTEDDILTMANIPYNAVLQVAEVEFPELIGVLSLALGSVFGELNSPVTSVRVRSLFLDGLPLCANPGLLGSLACSQIRSIAETNRNMAVQPDGSILFSVLGYKNGIPSPNYEVWRGVDDARDVGQIISYAGSQRLRYWPEGDEGSIEEHSPNACNTLRGTDMGIHPPFLQKGSSIFAFNSDICRSAELRYQFDSEYREVPVARFSGKEWMYDNHEGCFCLNLTRGITGPDGCLLRGAQELYSCLGGFLVLSNPHFLYADPAYLNGVIGMTPHEETHHIWLEVEPNTGVVIRGAAKAQFNIFLRPVSQISGTSNLPNVLTPLFWVEEGLDMPEEYLNEVKERLLAPLRLVDILVPVLVAFSCAMLVLGVGVTARARLSRSSSQHNK